MTRTRPNARRLAVLVIGLASLGTLARAPARAGEPFVRRPMAMSGSGISWQAAPAGILAARGEVPASLSIATVDTQPYTGYENAIYAADDSTVYVAYKRFLSDPSGGGYVPAELRVAKSTDGGRTWSITVVDPNAIEEADTVDNSVSIDGDHTQAVYVAYHVRSSGLFADMKLKVAKSLDGGSTWTTSTIADAYAGDQNSIHVFAASAAVVSAHANGTLEGIHAYITRDGGSTWSDTLVAGGLGNGYYTSVGAVNPNAIWVGYYNGLYPDDTDLNAGRRFAGGAWKTEVVDGSPGDPNTTGLGTSVTMAPGQVVYLAYEADTTTGTFVRVARSTDGLNWTIVPVQQDVTIGWNTAVHTAGASEVYVSYWRVPTGSRGMPMFAVSHDGGGTWTPYTIPDPRYAEPYLDSTAPSAAVQFESYQTVDPSTYKQPILRVARIGS